MRTKEEQDRFGSTSNGLITPGSTPQSRSYDTIKTATTSETTHEHIPDKINIKSERCENCEEICVGRYPLKNHICQTENDKRNTPSTASLAPQHSLEFSKPWKPVKRLIREEHIPGEGMYYICDDGSYVQKGINDKSADAQWGVTKIGKPQKRFAVACLACRERKNKCEPGKDKCIPCKKSGRECRYHQAPRRQQGDDLNSLVLETSLLCNNVTSITKNCDPPNDSYNYQDDVGNHQVSKDSNVVLNRPHKSYSTASENNTPNDSLSTPSGGNESSSRSSGPTVRTESGDEFNVSVEVPQYLKTLAAWSRLRAEKDMSEWREQRISRLVSDVRKIILREFVCYAPSDNSPNDHGDGQPTSSSSKAFVSTESTSKKAARKRPIQTAIESNRPNDGGEDSEDSDGHSRNLVQKRQKTFEPAQLYACHFYQKDPLMHVLRQSCKTGFRTVHRIKQHLQSYHMVPKYYCPTCWLTFQNADARDSQVKEGVNVTRRERPRPEMVGITEEQWDRIKPKKRKRDTPLEESEKGKWEEMWRTIFPGQGVPSPYFRDLASLLARDPEVERLVPYLFSHVREVFRPIFVSRVSSETLGMQNMLDVEHFVADVEQGLRILVSDFRSQNVTVPVPEVPLALDVSDYMDTEPSWPSMPPARGFLLEDNDWMKDSDGQMPGLGEEGYDLGDFLFDFRSPSKRACNQ